MLPCDFPPGVEDLSLSLSLSAAGPRCEGVLEELRAATGN